MLGGKIKNTCGFHLLSYPRVWRLNTIYDAKPLGYILHGVWGLEIIGCMLFLPYFYALDFYTNQSTEVLIPRTLPLPPYKAIGLGWRPVPLNSIFAMEWSLVYIPILGKEVSCSPSLTEHAISLMMLGWRGTFLALSKC